MCILIVVIVVVTELDAPDDLCTLFSPSAKDLNKQITKWVTPDPYNSFSPPIHVLNYMISCEINLEHVVSPYIL